LERQAALQRKRGDALQRAGETDKAIEEYRAGARRLEEALPILKDKRWYRLDEFSPGTTLPPDQLSIAKELVEVWGSRGGLLRRIPHAETAALESYNEGAEVEKAFVPKSTYNRVNAVKYALLSGQQTLEDLKGNIDALEKLLTEQLGEDQELSDKAWAWADLGDCRALIGDVAAAERAYRTFVDKAKSNAPKATLEVLGNIAAKLDETHDPKAAAIRASLNSLEQRLA